MDMASDRVIDMGSPSGTAITMIATETMKMWSACCAASSHGRSSSPPKRSALRSIVPNMATESAMPARPTRRERRSSWLSRGVGSSLRTVACSVTRPASVRSPTASTRMAPYPSATLVPRIRASEG